VLINIEKLCKKGRWKRKENKKAIGRLLKDNQEQG